MLLTQIPTEEVLRVHPYALEYYFALLPDIPFKIITCFEEYGQK